MKDRLAGDGHVVGVHDPMDEADVQPTGNEVCLGGDHLVEERAVGLVAFSSLRVVPTDDVVCEEA
jgi:hypothetical protein